MSFSAIVPVRAGSKGMPGKNLAPLAGVPLWRRAVDQGLATGAGRVVVTTDIAAVLEQSLPQVTMLKRPKDLAADDTPMAPVILNALQQMPKGRVVLLQATSPLRDLSDIKAAIALHEEGAFDLVKSVTPTDAGILKYGTMENGRFTPVSKPEYCFTNRQALPQVMRPNGAVYVFDRDWFLANGGFATDRIGAVVMPAERSFDIDGPEDFERAEALLS